MESPFRNRPDVAEYYRCSLCDVTVHINDKENHINGSKHKYRVRQRKLQIEHKSEPQLRCPTCNTKFSNLHFFTIHQGSKTHKRNLRRAQKKLLAAKRLLENQLNEPEKIIAEPQPAIPTLMGFQPKARRAPTIPSKDDLVLPVKMYRDISDYKSVREKYRPRNMKNPEGYNKTYICSVAAYWAVHLALDAKVVDFKISLNDKEWGDFGDAVVQVELKEADDQPSLTTTFAVQFKDICSNIKHIESLGEGRFAFSKFLNQVNNVQNQKTSSDETADYNKFVVFTTAQPAATMDKQSTLRTEYLHKLKPDCACNLKETSVVAKSLSNRKKLLINTADDNDNIFFFFCTDNAHTLPRIYLYTHQSKQKHFGAEIDELVSEHLYSDNKVYVHKEFLKYIENWCDGNLGGSYKLNKEDILVKLSHLLLSKFKVVSQVKTSIQAVDYGIWQRAVSTVDVVVLSNHSAILPKICDPINTKIERELDLKIDGTTRSIDLGQDTIQKIANPILKMYLFEETVGELHDHIPLDVVYDFFWKAGLTPLVLEVSDINEQYQVLDIISMTKSLGSTRRYFLITPEEDIKTSLRYHAKTLSFFVTLDDIAPKLSESTLREVKINVTDNFALSLKDIQQSDEFFQKSVTAHEFFDMSLGYYSFKSFTNNLARKEGQITQLVLGDDVLKRLKEEVDSKEELKWPLYQHENNEEEVRMLRGIRPNLFA